MSIFEKNLCRLCATECEHFVNVFSKKRKDTLTAVGEMMKECIFSEVTPNSGYPEIVCQYCNLQLNVFFEFKKKALNHHKKFTEYMTKTKSITIEKEDIKDDEIAIIFKQEEPPYEDNEYPTEEFLNDANNIEVLFDEDDQPEQSSSIENQNTENKGKLNHTPTVEYTKMEEPVDLEEEFYEEQYLEDEDIEVDQLENSEINARAQTISFETAYLDHLEANAPSEDIENMLKDAEYIEDTGVKSIDVQIALSKNKNKTADKKLKRKRMAYKCTVCSMLFQKIGQYRLHAKIHRIKEVCTVCRRPTFNLEDHMKNHQSDLQYKCTVCGKGFLTLTQCNSHEYRHLNLRPFPCTLCEKTFKLKADLYVHMLCHNDIRRYMCDICGKSFRMHSHLVDHRETHSSIKIQCDICGQLCSTRKTLKNHRVQVHSNERKYKCEICDKGFCMSNKLKIHLQTHVKQRRGKPL